MGENLLKHIEIWKSRLLDFGRRNRLINFKEGKRNGVKITLPVSEDFYESIVKKEEKLSFAYATIEQVEEDGESTYTNVLKGDIETSRSTEDLLKTLKNIRQKARIAQEEQGIHTLYLTFGMLVWKDGSNSLQDLYSPLILVPVNLTESPALRYSLTLNEEGIVLNPTLVHKLESELGFTLPEFDVEQDSPTTYLQKLSHLSQLKGWSVEEATYLTNLSFLKINMYKDLEKNTERLASNPVIATLAGERENVSIPTELVNPNHDEQRRPIDTYQVLDADSSQQDAILLSKRGVSFVLQGPPGTGKSQTITNIIAEAIADGRKVLFVSEKMAALQVVYSRLAAVGLSDFCLPMHSHKVSKKEVILNLASSLNLKKSNPSDKAIAQLRLLEKQRDLLNRYKDELHTPTSGLALSIYAVNGRLAQLEGSPDLIFSIPNIATISADEFSEQLYYIDRLSQTMSRRSQDYASNVWRDSTIRVLTNELRHDIDWHITDILTKMEALQESFKEVHATLGVSFNPSFDNIEGFTRLLSFSATSPLYPASWVIGDNTDGLLVNAELYKQQFERILKTKETVLSIFDVKILATHPEQAKERMIELMEQIKDWFTYTDIDQIAEDLGEIIGVIRTDLACFHTAFEQIAIVADLIGLSVPQSIEQLSEVEESLKALSLLYEITPTEYWFESRAIASIKVDIDQHQAQHDSVKNTKEGILHWMDKAIFEIDYYPILQRFRSEYRSIFRIFKKGYKQDIRELKKYIKDGQSLSYTKALDLLNKIHWLKTAESELLEHQDIYDKYYGRQYYRGIETQWERIREHLQIFDQALYSLKNLSPKLKATISEGLPRLEIDKAIALLVETKIETRYTALRERIKEPLDRAIPFDTVERTLGNQCEVSDQFVTLKKSIDELCHRHTPYTQLLIDIDLPIEYNRSEQELQAEEDSLRQQYMEYYEGLDTDWSKTIASLKHATELKVLVQEYDLPEAFVVNVCENASWSQLCQETSDKISHLYADTKTSFVWFGELFEQPSQFDCLTLTDLRLRLTLCQDSKELLEEWADYCSAKEACISFGLGEYIDQVETTNIDASTIASAYQKRFYRLWLDTILPQYPSVLNFRRRVQAKTIEEFRQLDKEQFLIAQNRIRQYAMSKIPDFNNISSSNTEISILKRELSKQKRHKPPRQLFQEIPNLLLSLRPCFMMSPLSVSLFLEADSYNFDLVIFDEASQVHTEDAIGAIMRGKQVIIVGDTKQLPPTDFFASAMGGDDGDNSDDEVVAYDSILDKASAVMPERSLRWHYRSKHEHLIAFSNVKVYNNQLITFPSTAESLPDLGVEYVYVPNGIYDRGGKRNNMIEAKRVVDLIFEHIDKYPGRSLGVVTFSEAQQDAIDTVLRKRRAQKPQYDYFFSEDIEAPFFIKNLENVQGDERDTIIFSIGYARDSQGIMSLNFGPLNRDGGHRRLNVAITRAKYNVKLVGSIVPTDIDVDRVSGDGLKMLRSYIEFAQQGISSLQRENTFSEQTEFDSVFEEVVYEYLCSEGYEVKTQVGCSGYRIDMAVRNPKKSGVFAIGIECDGASYHSSRTARERDRLRQEVLESMGWTIYRIWSTDWIKDPHSEKARLINAIERAINPNTPVQEVDDDDTPLKPLVSTHSTKKREQNAVRQPLSELPHEVIDVDVDASFKGDETEKSKCHYINQEELNMALRSVAQNNPMLGVDTLCNLTATALGYDPEDEEIIDAIQHVCLQMISKWLLRDIDGQLYTAPE